MASTERITIALPTFNGARHLGETLRSVHAQTDQDFDLIVSDDRSDDESLAIVRAVLGDRARIEVNSERMGLAGNWNRCVSLSQSDLVAIVHQDDLLHADHILRHRAMFAAHEGLGMVVSAAEVIDEQGRDVPQSTVGRGGLGERDEVFPPGALTRRLAVENPIRCSAVTLHRKAHEEVGRFDPSFRYAVDWDFWLRISQEWPVGWLASHTIAIRWHAASETHRFKSGTADLDESARLVERVFSSDEARRWPDVQSLRRQADRKLARAYLNRAYDASKAHDCTLGKLCLRRALRLWPGVWRVIIADPRLAVRVTRLILPAGSTRSP